MLNLSATPVTFSLKGDVVKDSYTDVFATVENTPKISGPVTLEAWGFKVQETK